MRRYLLYSDESGGAGEKLRALAAVAGPVGEMKKLEQRLKAIARDLKVVDLKWSRVRTRKNRLKACQDFLSLALESLAAGRLTLEVELWQVFPEAPGVKSGEDLEQLYRMYARLLKRTALAWPRGDWTFHPDKRTGMEWKRVVSLAAQSARTFRVTACRPLASRDNYLVQLADLAAGLARTWTQHSADLAAYKEGGPEGLKALKNRFAISVDFMENCRRLGIKPWSAPKPLRGASFSRE
jgi:hypothetical protein